MSNGVSRLWRDRRCRNKVRMLSASLSGACELLRFYADWSSSDDQDTVVQIGGQLAPLSIFATW
jgi:hypothetical protein